MTDYGDHWLAIRERNRKVLEEIRDQVNKLGETHTPEEIKALQKATNERERVRRAETKARQKEAARIRGKEKRARDNLQRADEKRRLAFMTQPTLPFGGDGKRKKKKTDL
jgi:hypothetical protein